MFSLSSQPSLDLARELLLTAQTSSLPAVLAGTKCDLRSNERVISYDDALTFAEENGCKYVETSSAVNINVCEAFQTAISMIVLQQQSMKEHTHICKVVKKHSTRSKFHSIWSRFNRFRRDKKLFDSLAVSPNTVEIDIMNLSSIH